ncbi:MAG: hypothetical protein MZV65_39800 [Chromatiales bacterium]|nr:hypothetical protein [Chromatiales bacterium]
MAALRILHVAPYFEHAWAYGGIPRVVSAQAHALAAAGPPGDGRDDGRARCGEPHGTAGGEWRSSRLAPRARAHRRRHRGARLPERLERRRLPLAVLHAARVRAAGSARTPASSTSRTCTRAATCSRRAPRRALRRAGVPYVVQPNGTARRIERRLAAKWVFDALFERRPAARMRRASSPSSGSERRQLRAQNPGP